MKKKHHEKHAKQLHRPLNAYELYELEHMPHKLVKVPSDHAKPRAHEAFRPDYYETGREMQPYWRPPEAGDVGIFRTDYYKTGSTVQPYWHRPEGDDGGISKEDVDDEAEKFILLEHEKFELSKWMSNEY